jgi:sugar/nucleoside kinase (ribokinase family)
LFVFFQLGDDSFGQEFHGVLKSNKINTDYVLITDGVPSGLAFITVAENGEMSLVDICNAGFKVFFPCSVLI